jgi:alcohol dehydrogenase class IV
MPSVMKNLAPLYMPKIKEFAQALGIKDIADTEKECLQQCIDEIVALRRAVNLPDDFSEFNINSAEIPELISAIQNDPSGQTYRIPNEVIEQVCREVLGAKVIV